VLSVQARDKLPARAGPADGPHGENQICGAAPDDPVEVGWREKR
jgi:hypothetical protein